MRKRLRDHEWGEPAEPEHEQGPSTWAELGSDMEMDWETLIRVKREGQLAERERDRKIRLRGE